MTKGMQSMADTSLFLLFLEKVQSIQLLSYVTFHQLPDQDTWYRDIFAGLLVLKLVTATLSES